MPTKICQLCYGKAKVAVDFIDTIIYSQRSFKFNKNNKGLVRKTTEIVKLSAPLKVNDVVAKMKQNSGISIRKIFKSNPISFPEVEVKTSVKEMEFIQEDNDYWDGVNVINSSEEDVFAFEGSGEGEEDSDDNYKPYYDKPSSSKKSTSRTKGVYINAPITFTCSKCKSTFKDFCTLSMHMKEQSCTAENHIIKCKKCGKEFSEKKHLYRHHKVHQSKAAKFICEDCGMAFTSTFDLDTHMESAHRRVVKRDCIYRCSHCQAAFNSHLDLLEHIKEDHSKEKKDSPKLCEVCAKECPNNRSYHSHMASHRQQRKFVCDVSRTK